MTYKINHIFCWIVLTIVIAIFLPKTVLAAVPDCTTLVCDDSNSCTTDSCDRVLGCVYTPVETGASCDDSNACTQSDVCSSGVCTGSTVTCSDDGNVCTTASCDPTLGCIQNNNTAACDDGNGCTVGDVCSGSLCQAGAHKSCNDNNTCTTDQCNPATGSCAYVNNTVSCSDGNDCTVSDVCTNGVCKPTSTLNCEDNNPCTAESCDPVAGCVHTPVATGTSCDDSNVCTQNDVCSSGVCTGSTVTCSDDGNVCTTASCDPTLGCIQNNNTAACDDANGCTLGDVCSGSRCQAGAPKSCNDNNTCTTDQCNPATGSCAYVNNTVSCTDNNNCTTGDVCSNGVCKPGTTLSCDDNNPCTAESCDAISGCVHTPVVGACSGLVLTVSKSGSGTGKIISNPAGLNCGATCSFDFAAGTFVTLTATADANSIFSGWSDPACVGTAPCTITIAQAKSVTATFTAITPPGTVTVSKNGTGVGTVSSIPAGINCGATCSANFVGIRIPAVIILRASPDANSVFVGWGGACSGSSTLCRVSKSTANSVSATFTAKPKLTVTKTGNGTGTVTSSSGGINCGPVCEASFNSGQSVTLTARSSIGSTFAGWSGACSGTGSCTVTVNQNMQVSASFQTTRFFKISGAGIQLPATAGSWNCVKDNNTGLVWEVKTNSNNLHSQNWSYSWYDPNNNTNGGNSGTQNRENRCGTGNTCNTDAYAKAVNRIGWCGAKNWRLPTREELAGIVDTSKRPTIDPLYFPNTVQDVFWTSTTDAQDSRNAWYVYFANGGSNRSIKSEVYRVRLVHQ
ncbi:DUF1566 domain-containing protein [Crenothrix polyspora]|uniref:Bacterial repeat domain-containing protein n=1 Tax=Crenothrix polyspora TaxID=360316 RepID=A0A1R4H9F5_9GAMM|nr:DUF1566 domain-containing protein [Crenothrix polyspora]SJM92816.1 exported hypothetical protein [Crenothrix polyspora]